MILDNHFRLKESVEETIRLTEVQAAQLDQVAADLRSDKEYWRNKVKIQDGRYFDFDEISDDSRAISIQKVGGGLYRVRVHNAIGAIGLDGVTLFIEPKIPISHFSYIAERAILRDFRTSKYRALISEGHNFFDVIASWFILELEAILRSGLSRDYQELEGSLNFVRGRVLVRPTVSNWMRGRADVDSCFEEFDENNSTNRVIKAALSQVSRSPSIGDGIKARARKCSSVMSHVGSLESTDLAASLSQRRYLRSPVVEFALQILRGMGLALNAGNTPSRTFLIPTPTLIESGLREILRQGLVPIVVEKRGIRLGDTWLTVTPDALIDRPPFTADVKYKLSKGNWQRNDLAQAVLFAEAFYSNLGVVLSFSADDNSALPKLPIGKINIASVTWPVSENWEPEQAEQFVLEEFRNLIKGSELRGRALVGSAETF